MSRRSASFSVIAMALAIGLSITSFAAAKSPTDRPQACWLETSATTMDAAMGGAGLRETPVWKSTISSVLVRHARGDVLIDTGFGPNAEAQMSELPPAGKAFGLGILSGAKDRKSILDELATANEPSAQLARIVVTHAHYDHLGGATDCRRQSTSRQPKPTGWPTKPRTRPSSRPHSSPQLSRD
jgi:N-acyl homoserine lactone hydrolase